MSNIVTRDAKGNYIISVAKPEDYFSKRNNEIDPMNSCATTNMVQALSILGYTFPDDTKYKQPEDRLINFIRTDERVLSFYKEKHALWYNAWKNGEKDCNNPNEVHDVLSYGTNLWMGKKVTEFVEYYNVNNLPKQIFNMKPVVMSGKFNNLNHIITLVGLMIPSNIYENKIVDDIQFNDIMMFEFYDTYGKTYDYHSGESGKGVFISRDNV